MVKCAECGLFCYKDRNVYEHIDEKGRRTGNLPLYRVGDTPLRFSHKPRCFAVKADFDDEYAKLDDAADKRGGQLPELLLKVITADRECDAFIRWVPGFSPKEHKEMMQEERLLEWQKEQRQEDKRQFRTQLIVLVVCAGLASIASMVGSILQAWATWKAAGK